MHRILTGYLATSKTSSGGIRSRPDTGYPFCSSHIKTDFEKTEKLNFFIHNSHILTVFNGSRIQAYAAYLAGYLAVPVFRPNTGQSKGRHPPSWISGASQEKTFVSNIKS